MGTNFGDTSSEGQKTTFDGGAFRPMTRMTHWMILGVLASLAAAAFAPISTHADSRQDNKNFWRNGTIAGGVAALYGLHNHDTTTTLLSAAGTAYAAHRYEQDRHSQDEAQRARERQRALYYRRYASAPSYHRTYRGYTTQYVRRSGHRRYSRRSCRCR